jgi:hypothetical protein
MNLIRNSLIGVALAMAGSLASAISFQETGDAGDLPSTSQAILGSGALTSFSGMINSATDVDMYRIQVNATMPVLLQVASLTTIDAQLFIFDNSGFAVLANDDLPTSLDASITANLAPGLYYVAVSAWDRDPVDANGAKLFTDAAGELQMPIAGVGAVAGWVGLGGIGSYTINATNVAAIPEPQTYGLMLAGLAVVGCAARRRPRR